MVRGRAVGTLTVGASEPRGKKDYCCWGGQHVSWGGGEWGQKIRKNV